MANNTEITEEISEMTEEVRHGRGGVASDVVKSLNVSIYIMDVRNFNRKAKPPTIHRIPVDFRKGNESAYTPTQFSIGPYHRHHEDKPLFLNGETDGIKILYLHHLLKRNPNNKLKNYASAIESREEEARDCYQDRCKGFQSKDFVEMMVLDGCFIVELFLKCWEKRIDESWILNDGNKRDLRHDLMLMENQFPFFILKLIHDSSQYQVEGDPGILDLALYCLYYLGCYSGKKITMDMLNKDHHGEDGKNIYHLLHLNYLCHVVEIDPEMEPFCHHVLKWVLYWVFLLPIKYFILVFFYALFFFLKNIKFARNVMRQKPNLCSPQLRKVRAENPIMLPTATELKEYGVIFKRKKNAKNYMDVSFENGIMEIPVLKIDDNTNSKFRNFLALEYFCPNLGNDFATYVVFLDVLINTTGDLLFLKNRKIIISSLGCDEDVAKLFNEMTDGLMWDTESHYLLKVFWDVGIHWKKNKTDWKKNYIRWKAMLMRNYFSSPWSIMSLLAFCSLLAMTAVQVHYAIRNG